ncbi:MAG: nucleoside triphosphate pyrophosphohydrolase family protein [Patescibacteria group bacterium]
MTLREYDDAADGTALYKDRGHNLMYAVLGLAGESGEVADKLKKIIREISYDPKQPFTPEDRKALLAEVGDVLWYVSACAHELGSTLDEVAQMNIEKLASRKARGVLHGSGDNR